MRESRGRGVRALSGRCDVWCAGKHLAYEEKMLDYGEKLINLEEELDETPAQGPSI